jgi:hypothetical protein
MNKQQFFGGSIILNLTSRKRLPQSLRTIVIKGGAGNGVSLPEITKLCHRGAPIWYLVNDDTVDLEVYDSDNILLETIPVDKCAIIGFSGQVYDVMIRDKYQSAYFPFETTPLSVTITENQENFNLRDYVDTNFSYNGIEPLILTVTINSGIIIGGTSPTETAFDSGTWPSGTVIHLYNNGEILGAGGGIASHTYGGGGVGGRGGDAIKLQNDLILYNVNGRIAGGGGQGASFYYDESSSQIGQFYCAGGQGYVGGSKGPELAPGEEGTNGSPTAPGITKELTGALIHGPNKLFNTRFKMTKNFGRGGWYGCPGEEYCYEESKIMFKYGSVADKNEDGESKSIWSGAPGRSILNAEYLTVSSIGKITGPSADFVNTEFVYYLCEPWANQIPLGKTLKKIGWNGTSSPTVSMYIGPNCIIGHLAHYHPHNKDDYSAPDHGFTADGNYRVQPNSILIESDWPVGTTINIENHGKIYGGGGCGGKGIPPSATYQNEQYICGNNGGNAIGIYFNTTINNQGTIAGGGGGGGAKGSFLQASTTSFWGYTWNNSNLIDDATIPGSGGAGAGYAYGPFDISGTTYSFDPIEPSEAEFNMNAGQASTLTTGGRGGQGTGDIVTSDRYGAHYPLGDTGRIFETVRVWNGSEYVEELVDPDKSFYTQDEQIPWQTIWENSPWAIDSAWYNTPLTTSISGGDIGQAGSDAGTPLSQFSLGSDNVPAGQPGYYVYGNSFVTWTNIGTRLGLVGG